jgi:hypothetical protein
MNETMARGAADWLSLEGEEFVRAAYQRLLERPADLPGLHNYTAQLMAGMPKEQLVSELENSPEGRLVARRRGRSTSVASAPGSARVISPARRGVPSTVNELMAFEGEEFVRMAYFTLLGREADPSGLQYYTQRLAHGESREQIIADLHSDPEGQARGAEIPGLREVYSRLQESVRAPRVQTAADLLALHGTKFVKAAYVAILGREADPAGLSNYMELLRNGYSRSHVLAALASSPEGGPGARSLPGLPQLVTAYRKGQAANWRGWYWRNVKGVESDLPPAREARRLNWAAENH